MYGEARNALVPGSLRELQDTARERGNVFERLMETVKYNPLGRLAMRCMRWGVSEEYVRTSNGD
jgi:hypothetical protein